MEANYINIEIKARCFKPDSVRKYLVEQAAEFRGVDKQRDTYFNVPNGRLKLREGNIENNLIFYDRPNEAGPKKSAFQLVKVSEPSVLKDTLALAMGIKVVVEKTREIYYIKNVKFHIDEVPGLGSFVEIEAGNLLADISRQDLELQCDFYLNAFAILPGDMIDVSYSDMLLAK